MAGMGASEAVKKHPVNYLRWILKKAREEVKLKFEYKIPILRDLAYNSI